MTFDIDETNDLTGLVLNAIPSPVLVVDDDVKIQWFNLAGARLLAREPDLIIRRRAGEVLHCVHARQSPEGCGHGSFCPQCPVRAAVTQALQGQDVTRRRAHMELVSHDTVTDIYLLITTAPLDHDGGDLVLLILEDISELMELKNIIPICAYCKKVRDDQLYWQSVENYFKAHLDLGFSHGICPDCYEKLLKPQV